MGIHNTDTSKLTGKLKAGLCPYCGNKIQPNNHLHLGKENDCFDFVCGLCNPLINICIPGSCFPLLQSWDDFEKKELSHHFKTKRKHQSKIKNAKGLSVSIVPTDFK